LDNETGFLPKPVSQKHIFDSSKTLGAIQRPKRAKIGPKEGPKYKISYCEAKRDFKVSKIHSWDVELVFYSKEATISIFLTIVIL